MTKLKKQPIIAIVGRPNVGKSTLFNRVIKQRKSIVDDTPGVTRDKLYDNFEWNGKKLTLIDTGGLILGDDDEITSGVRKQVYMAFEEADYILFLVDGNSGITALDEKIAGALRKIKDKKHIFLAVNKIDTEKQLPNIYEFYSLGFGEPYPVSALSGSAGLADIFDEIADTSSTLKANSKEQKKIAIVGKPNVGKSSLLNCLINEERAIVTSIPGTTRDSLDSKIKVHGKEYILTDTAGLRKKSRVSTNIERYATVRTISAIENSDVVALVLDVNEGITDQDKKIASVIKNRNKASIIIANKWDLVEEKSSQVQNQILDYILESLQFVKYSKVLFTSAIQRKNVYNIWELIEEAFVNYAKRIPTAKLNQAVEDIVLFTTPPTGKGGKALRIYYVTQTNVNPPEIVFFVNDSDLVKPQYERFLEKELRGKFDFSSTPLKLVFRNKRKKTNL
ncbi:MAG: ribosome biogenesis GTPase Der [Candidatus Melainabacteria bacterium]|nr:ribosome biogenesis GTPase Der [Candidatus Melainabacteria bacterium]